MMPDIFGLLSLPNLTDEDFDFIAEVLVESESVSKHEGGGHDQKTHGNWAKGRAEEYQGQHTPPEDAAPLHDLLAEGTWFPDDVYTHPQFYVHGDDDVVAESLAAIREARGKPDALITVYRSVPPGVTSINTGDWVSLSRAYAENHGAERDREYWDADREWTIEGPTPETTASGVGQWVSYDKPRDWPVVEAKVPARLILNGGNDLIEWGYWGPDVEDGEAISKHAEHDQKSHGNWASALSGSPDRPESLGTYRPPAEFNDRIGRCYELSWRTVTQMPKQGYLVHGSIQGAGKERIPHAWTEVDDLAYDPVLDEWFPAEFYRDMTNAEVAEKYTKDEVNMIVTRELNMGPWHDEPYGLKWYEERGL